MSNRAYDRIKIAVMLIMPFGQMITGIVLAILTKEITGIVLGIAGALEEFGGVLLTVLSKVYYKKLQEEE